MLYTIRAFFIVALLSIFSGFMLVGCGGGVSDTGDSADTTPPTISNEYPTGAIPSGTTQTNLSLETNESASCRYAIVPGTAYDSMTDFSATFDGLTHSISVPGLADGNDYNFYVRCRDNLGNTNADDYPISFSVAVQVIGTDYYVDFDGGNDISNGLSTGTPWKHAPGDPQATDNPGGTILQPGDTVLFRGGVVYRGTVIINADGSAGAPITYKGDGWEAQKAIIDGSELLEGVWTPCPDSATCGDNPNWPNIYSIDAPPGFNFFTTLYEDDQFLWFSQDPNPAVPFYYDRTSDFHVIPPTDITRTTVTDSVNLTQAGAGFWDGAYVAAWRIPNVVVIRAVTGFNPATDTITFEDLGNDLYTDRDEYYSILNHISLIDTAGEYSFDSTNQRIYVLPHNPGNPALHEYTRAERRVGIDINSHSFITIEGLKIQKHFGDFGEHNLGVGIRSLAWNISSRYITIRNNDITKNRTMEGSGAIRLYNGDNVMIENNTITDNQRSVGILAGSHHITVKNNFVSRNSRNGIWFMGTHNSRIVGNTVTDIRGTHSNGISVYLDSSNILVAGNKVTNAPSPFTFEASHNLTVINNIFDGADVAGDGNSNVNEWGSAMTGTVLFLNNTLVRNSRNAALNIGNSSAARYIIKNNIIDGYCPDAGNTEWSHNIYTGLGWCQDPDTDFGESDLLQTDLDQIFVNAGAGDFRLIAGSEGIDNGIDTTPYFPLGSFPDYNFATDLGGNVRPLDGEGHQWQHYMG